MVTLTEQGTREASTSIDVSVRIVTDSTADIPAELASELDISIVPCLVTIGTETFQDRVDLSPVAYYKRLAEEPTLPRTSQPAIRDFVSTFHRLLVEEQSERVISIHVAGSFSGTLNAAWAAAQQMPEPERIHVIDSGTVSMGMGWVVIAAARLAQTGAGADELDRAIFSYVRRLRTAAMIDSLDNLYKGGRISQISAMLGTALQIKPLLSLQDGEALVWGRVRTRSRALAHLIARVKDWGPLAEMAIMHTGAEALADRLTEELQGLVPADRVLVEPAGAALTAHLGLGAVGVCALVAEGAGDS